MSLPQEDWKDVPHSAHPDDGAEGCEECEAHFAIIEKKPKLHIDKSLTKVCPECFMAISPDGYGHLRASCTDTR